MTSYIDDDPFWARLSPNEGEQFQEYFDMMLGDPEAIVGEFSPSRRHEFMRLLAKGLGADREPELPSNH